MSENESDVKAVEELHRKFQSIRLQMGGVIIGMEEVIEQLLVVILCRGHGILEGTPGLAKTLIVSTTASMLNLTFRRIQFTPDLMPADITGADVLEEDVATGHRSFRFVEGPLFGNIILADEINRTPPKTQSALLEAMQERQLTVSGTTYQLPDPFLVLATQNPIEHEGTYQLPEAQLDRFMLKIQVRYPSRQDEINIVKRATTEYEFQPEHVLSGDDIKELRKLVRRVPVADHVYEFAVDLAQMSRPGGEGVSDFVSNMVQFGGGPRASINLLMAAKARAILHGRFHTTTEDVAAMAPPVMRHRLVPTFNAEAEGYTSDLILDWLIKELRQHPAYAE